MKAIIISAGDGTKLRPITCSLPHCLLPVMGQPVIEHTLRHLNRHNITNAAVISTYLTEEIKKHFAFNPLQGMTINFCTYDDMEELIKNDDLLFISDSLLFDTDLTELISVHRHSGSDVTAVTMHSSSANYYGVFCTGKDGFATEYNRCPDFAQIFGIPFMGIAVIKKGTEIKDCKNIQSIMESLMKNNFSIYCHSPRTYIREISDFDSYLRCCRDFMDKKISLPVRCREKAPSVWIDEGATVMQGAVITPPVYIGKDSMVNKGARVEAYTQILQNVILDCNSNVKRSIVMDNSYISEGVALRGAIVGKGCTFGEDCAAYEGSVTGFCTKLGNRATIRTSVHIWPDKFIEDEAVVSENLTWENARKTNFLMPGKAEGIINRDLTPEFAVQLARALTLFAGKKIAVSCDDDGIGQMIKNALIAGIQSGGGKAYDMGEQPLPITRSGVRFYSLDGAVSVSVKKNNPPVFAAIDILDSRGVNIDKEQTRKLAQLIDETVFGKTHPIKIPAPEYIYEYKLYYLKKLINSTSKKSLGMKLLIHAPSPWAKELLKSAAKDLNCSFSFTDNAAGMGFLREIAIGGYDFGAICDYKCEKLTLVTKNGQILSEFDYAVLTSLIIMMRFPDTEIYVPESVPDSIDALAKAYSASITRTSIDSLHLLTELSKSNQKSLLYQYIYRFDAVGSVIILLDSLSEIGLSLEELLSEIPPYGTVSESVTIPKNQQPDTLKKLYEKYNAQTQKTDDAVRLDFENGWVMVIGDKDRSMIKIISHSQNKEYAREIADICIDDISR